MAQGINGVMKNILRTPWTKTDDFAFSFYNKSRPLKVTGNAGMNPDDIFEMCVEDIEIPQLGSSAESVIIGGEYRIYNAKFRPFTLTVKFRDFGSLDLRTYFTQVWIDAQRGYFDDVKSHIKISARGNIVFESEECLITDISQVTFNNDNSQIAEFSVSFTSPFFSNKVIRNFGSDAYGQKDKEDQEKKISENGTGSGGKTGNNILESISGGITGSDLGF